MFNLSDEALKEIGAFNTVRETQSQPKLWIETFALYRENKEKIEAFIKSVKEKDDRVLRVVFTGAGSSEYVGNVLIQYLAKFNSNRLRFESIATTDLVSCPYNYLNEEDKVLLISFARSGNSPESVAAVNLVNQIVKDAYHMPITCAKEGQLSVNLNDNQRALVLLTPEKTLDKGFAMTSSFSCMMLYALLIFDENKNIDEKSEYIHEAAKSAQKIIDDEKFFDNLQAKKFNRVIYLGSGVFGYLTKEARLKILELSAGQIATLFDTSMGFRHGPKSFVNSNTVIVLFASSNPYTSKYDIDVVKEIENDAIACDMITLSQSELDVNNNYNLNIANRIPDEYAIFPYIVFAQIFSIRASLKVGNTPDTPSKSGTVNRVVKGVIIHEYNE